jgi:SAM-dependent methyltransferase
MADQSADTIAYYDHNATGFTAQTAELEMSPLYERFLRHVPTGGRILDAGCGVGRDVRAFAELGFEVVGFDASAEMVKLARERADGRAEIRQMRFEDVVWRGEFDGIWASASLLHISRAEFPGVFGRLLNAMRPSGSLYMSFKLGKGERLERGRLFVDYTEEILRETLRKLPAEVIEAWTSADLRPGRADESWLNIIARWRRMS